MALQVFCNLPPSREALMRLYKNYIKISADACVLLELTPGSRITFMISNSGVNPGGRNRLYICRKKFVGYKLAKCGRAYRVNDTTLCRLLADALQGYGTYRIESENSVRDFSGDICYSIFFRRYD